MANYTYICGPNNTKKRIKNQSDLVGGGPTTDQIDRLLEDPSVKMPLKWKGSWKFPNDSWYDYLDIGNDYIVEKCRERGVDNELALKILSIWGNRFHKISNERPRTTKEGLGYKLPGNHRLNKDIRDLPKDIKDKIEGYMSTVVKEAEKNAYQQCKLSVHPSNLPTRERMACHDIACQYGIRRDSDYERVIENDEHEHEHDAEKLSKLERCKELGMYCQSLDDARQEYPAKLFTHVKNGGSGDCLFIAVAHYRLLAERLGEAVFGQVSDPIYPDPENLELFKKPDGSYIKVDYLPKHSTYLLSDELHYNANYLRAAAVEWLRDNPDYLLPQNRTVKLELAQLYMEEGRLLFGQSDFIRTMNKYISNKRDDPNSLKLVKFTRMNIDNQIRRLFSIITDEDDYLEKYPERQPNLEEFIEFLYEQYLRVMSHRVVYGGQPEIIALANVLQTNIYALLSSNSKLIFRLGGRVEATQDNIFIFHNKKATAQKGNEHYDIVFPAVLLGNERDIGSGKLQSPPLPLPRVIDLSEQGSSITVDSSDISSISDASISDTSISDASIETVDLEPSLTEMLTVSGLSKNEMIVATILKRICGKTVSKDMNLNDELEKCLKSLSDDNIVILLNSLLNDDMRLVRIMKADRAKNIIHTFIADEILSTPPEAIKIYIHNICQGLSLVDDDVMTTVYKECYKYLPEISEISDIAEAIMSSVISHETGTRTFTSTISDIYKYVYGIKPDKDMDLADMVNAIKNYEKETGESIDPTAAVIFKHILLIDLIYDYMPFVLKHGKPMLLPGVNIDTSIQSFADVYLESFDGMVE